MILANTKFWNKGTRSWFRPRASESLKPRVQTDATPRNFDRTLKANTDFQHWTKIGLNQCGGGEIARNRSWSGPIPFFWFAIHWFYSHRQISQNTSADIVPPFLSLCKHLSTKGRHSRTREKGHKLIEIHASFCHHKIIKPQTVVLNYRCLGPLEKPMVRQGNFGLHLNTLANTEDTGPVANTWNR